MDEVENKTSVVEQVAPAETDNHVSNEQNKVATEVKEDPQERNWKAIRERQKELERELKMQREMNERLMQMTAQAAPQPKQEVDELDSISDEEYIPKGKVKKLVEQSARKYAQQLVQEETQKVQQSQFLDRLKRQFSDFDEVVNQETLALLEQNDPELASTIAELKDPYKIGLQTYKYIKAAGITDKAPQARRLKEVEKKLEDNAKTVQSPQAYDKRPMAEAYRMTDADKSKLYEEMTTYASQVGFSY